MIWLLLLMVLELDIVVYMFYYLRLDVKVDCVKLVTLRVMCGLGMCRWDEGGCGADEWSVEGVPGKWW